MLEVDAMPNLSAAPSSGCGMQSLAFDAAIDSEATESMPSVLARVSMTCSVSSSEPRECIASGAGVFYSW